MREIVGNIVIKKDAKPLDVDLAARIFLGVSLERLVEDVQKYPEKYKELFEEAPHDPT